ncbi:MAG: hypothetical protein IPK33_07930 [Gemmatimonadetes bacterium]|nr:hypothetical protein [Gemmatimonadota bacterium]
MTRATSTTIPAFVLALAATVGCATSRPRLQLPPYTLMSATTLDSARSLVREALDSARMTVDGAPAADADVVTSTFVVRRGGMGEAEIRLRVRLQREPADDARAGIVLVVDATARDRNRMLTMSPEEMRSPRMSRDPHPINENDRESLQRIARLLDLLKQRGFLVAEGR